MDTLALLAAGEVPAFVQELAQLLVVGALIAFVCHRIGLVPIVGFLLTGVAIGPSALGLVHDPELVDAVAELGVMLLLFTIGIEFSLERLARMRTTILGGGGLQVLLTAGTVTGLLALFGVAWRTGLYTGFLVALSSTAIVLKVLADRSRMRTEDGRFMVGTLILQDIAIVPMVLLVPMLGGAGEGPADLALVFGKSAAIVVLVVVVARRLMPPVLERVARTCSPELFLLTVMAICIGTAWVTSLAGVSLSLGAFLAGVVVSESRYSQHALGEILPIQILFNAAFFMSVGMLLDLRFVAAHWPLVLGAVAGVLVLKAAAAAVSARALGLAGPVALSAGLGLAQVGEFSFVLERAGRQYDLAPFGLPETGSHLMIAATVLLMALTPLLLSYGQRVAARRLDDPPRDEGAPDPHGEVPPLSNHAVLIGYGPVGRRLQRALDLSGVPSVVVTLSPVAANEAEAQGLPVVLGDPVRQRTLSLAHVERAKTLVVPEDDPALAHRVVMVARSLNPTMRIVVHSRRRAEIEMLKHAGADEVIAEEVESVVQLLGDVLAHYEVPSAVVANHVETLRRGGYAALLSAEKVDFPNLERVVDADQVTGRRVTLREGARAIGRTLADLDLRRAHGLLAVGLERAGRGLLPAPDLVLEIGDELELRGSVDGFESAATLFRPASPDPSAPPSRAAGRVDTETAVALPVDPEDPPCAHAAGLAPVRPRTAGCETCLREGRKWVHLRVCMHCGHVGCCDTSAGQHASAHWKETGHPVARSLEPGERWGWCFEDDARIVPAAEAPAMLEGER